MLARYQRLNARHPLITKSAISGVLLGAADASCQQLEAASGHFSWERVGRMAAWGLLVNGPAGHYFYAVLDRFIRRAGAIGIVSKIGVDQLAFTPPLTAGFFAFQSLAAGGTPAEAMEIVRHETWPTLLHNWCFWGVAHVITFTVVPLEHRVAWVALKNFAWSGFLSWRLSHLEESPREREAMQRPVAPQGAARAGEDGSSRRLTHAGQLLRRYSEASELSLDKDRAPASR